MTEAEALLADLRSRGIELQTDGARLRWRPAFLVSPGVERTILAHKAGLIALLTGPAAAGRMCPACSWPLDSGLRCPKCPDRLCVECGRLTGSYLVMRCVPC